MNKKSLLLVFATAIISGVSIYLNKFAATVANPVVFTFLKNSLVAIILCLVVIGIKNRILIKKLSRSEWMKLLIIGLVGGSIPFILFFKGLSMTSAVAGSFIHKTMFLYVAILALVFLKEKINKYFLAGAFLVIIGNLIVTKEFIVSINSGDMLVFLATLFWSVENIISKKALKTINSDIVTWGRMFFGAILIFIYILLSGQANLISGLDLHQIGWTLVTSALLFGYVFTWYKGLAKIPVSVATSVLLLGSPITTMLAFFSSGQINWNNFSSALLVSAGVLIITFFSYEKSAQKEAIGA